jgi:hypothetical protein
LAFLSNVHSPNLCEAFLFKTKNVRCIMITMACAFKNRMLGEAYYKTSWLG